MPSVLITLAVPTLISKKKLPEVLGCLYHQGYSYYFPSLSEVNFWTNSCFNHYFCCTIRREERPLQWSSQHGCITKLPSFSSNQELDLHCKMEQTWCLCLGSILWIRQFWVKVSDVQRIWFSWPFFNSQISQQHEFYSCKELKKKYKKNLKDHSDTLTHKTLFQPVCL